jgi:tripeptidyl-peptidase-1
VRALAFACDICLILEHAADITAHMQPSPQSMAAFNTFALDNGLNVTAGGGHGEWMSFTTNVSHANALFVASFQKFQHSSAVSPITRTLSYSLPFALAEHVDTVYPMTTFGTPRARRNTSPEAGSSRPRKRQQAYGFNPVPIVPYSLQLLYNIPLRANDSAGISILITGYLDDMPQINDTTVGTCSAQVTIMLTIACKGIPHAVSARPCFKHVSQHHSPQRGS